jgi:D-alanyl-D-alanine dipeptidase
MCNLRAGFYPFPAAFVHRDVAISLKGAGGIAGRGLCLKIFDGYRPFSVQKKMWALVPDERPVSIQAKARKAHPRDGGR